MDLLKRASALLLLVVGTVMLFGGAGSFHASLGTADGATSVYVMLIGLVIVGVAPILVAEAFYSTAR